MLVFHLLYFISAVFGDILNEIYSYG